MRYLPHTEEDIAEMLRVVGVHTLDDLFSLIPKSCCCRTRLDLPEAISEWELNSHMVRLAGNMAAFPEYETYLGAGSYEHFIPASVSYLLGRSEFVTSYTPYQPEMSQGTLQAIYEYQTLVSRLLGMEVANASLYDGASALAEALLMAIRITRRKKVAISRCVHPNYRQVVRTYLAPTGFEVIELPYLENGHTDIQKLDEIEDLAGVAVQSPNFFGSIEDLQTIGEMTHKQGALFITAFTEPMAYGILKNPGTLGADVVCGEGQSFGIPQSFGGPGLGMFASKMKYVRNMPGRLVGKTKDADGKKGFVLTLATREQHIRRGKATSNICTNSSLCALAAAIYMASVGSTGLRYLARLNHDKCEYLKKELVKAGFAICFNSPTFNEFVVEFPKGFENRYQELLGEKIVAGYPIAADYPELLNHYLFCVTEIKSRDMIDTLVREIQR
ncbi:MAG: aminomethyl-transferring glycine dehydrogenase subunit GcvPA [Desulfobacterales bacterium]|jgi:glycine dehydrogenase subunit 1|nr:aminomethyl-transferring glycine dehydrogenase subunit GcvPA [Desulfobacterales bacterium]MDP6681652.1 aminomethyl-transferring glycine dehydrogenase subunit GcvPA [Desulfobacterales bacterium]MDP6806722.1 aminomethyl-transferring glycine dehydrogenase subunit GcvPA [Desulfobacterales bacterium]|tara:strand:- start:16344 stop:17675 length:1332 start_codon:yes stop_codon:yes gene_type:complete